MVFITEELLRKRAEHNNYELSTLEEISLHQQEIEKIEHLDKWCRELKILYLQSNLIPRIENVSRLKKLEYLNLALNNVTKIENLEGCESLNKLDLTVNFVGELSSVESLKNNSFLRELYLTGNPCTQYEDYREYVIAVLPQLKFLDGKEIEKSERIQAIQELSALRDSILQQQKRCKLKEEREKKETKAPGHDGKWYTEIGSEQDNVQGLTSLEAPDELTEEEKEKKYWSEPTPFTPESRVEVHNHMKEQQRKKDAHKGKYFEKEQEKRVIKFFKDNGEPLNVNTAKIDFTLKDDEESGTILLDVACYKHMDTSLIDLDIQPKYVRVTIKEKVLQLALMEEVNPDKAEAKRSQTTGHLLVTLPKAAEIIRKANIKQTDKSNSNERNRTSSDSTSPKKDGITLSDLSNIVKQTDEKLKVQPNVDEQLQNVLPDDFIDNPDVPPLM